MSEIKINKLSETLCGVNLDIDFVGDEITVGRLIEFLQTYDCDTKVVIG